MATKIRLLRLGKMRAPYYRVVVADSRTKRDGRVIETIGKYHPKEEPSFIEIDGERALHWLRVGAQPTEAVEALLKVTGTWQEFKGLPAPPPMKVKEARPDKKAVFEAAAKSAAGLTEDKPKKGQPKSLDEKIEAAGKPDKAANAKAAADQPTSALADPSLAAAEVTETPDEAAAPAEGE